jgi:hypothetical protein
MTGAQSLRFDSRADFELTSFEEVRATPATSLLRLTGRWRGSAQPPASPVLIVDIAGRRQRLAPLAGPRPQSGALWRAGYAIPPDMLATPGVSLALETGVGEVPLPLPSRVRAPSIATASGPTTPRAQAGPASVVSINLSDDDLRERARAERLTRELERAHREIERLGQLEERLRKSEAALASAEAQVETLRVQLQEARAHAAELAARSGREQPR